MTQRHDEKGDETVAFRVPEKLAAGLRDRARWSDLTPSELMRQIVEQFLINGNCANVSMQTNALANKSNEQVAQAIEAAKAALEAVSMKIGIPAGREGKRRKAS